MNSAWCIFVVGLLQITHAFSADCNWSFYQHYEQKGCQPELGDNGCPVRFNCKPLTDAERKTCIHNGKRYNDREVIQTSDPCDDCVCSSRDSDAIIECAEVDCPEWYSRNESCRMENKPELCCPTEVCISDKEDTRTRCNFNGKTFKVGDYIEVPNPCQSCICTEQWTGVGGPGCSFVDCKMGLYARQLRKGCLPIYRENGCCPIEIYCGGIYGATHVSYPEIKKENLCHYQGQYYQPGSTAYLQSDKYQCVSCECAVPPDFTCVRKACPQQPSKNCKARYGPCCPTYECD